VQFKGLGLGLGQRRSRMGVEVWSWMGGRRTYIACEGEVWESIDACCMEQGSVVVGWRVVQAAMDNIFWEWKRWLRHI
jgi:hypothetical protein